jgi:hypothetical protein
MKRSILVALVAFALIGVQSVRADMAFASVIVTNGQSTISDSISASGWLDRIEIEVTGSSTSAR